MRRQDPLQSIRQCSLEELISEGPKLVQQTDERGKRGEGEEEMDAAKGQ